MASRERNMNPHQFAKRTRERIRKRQRVVNDVRLMTDDQLAAAFYGMPYRPGMKIRQPSDEEICVVALVVHCK